MPNGDTGGHWMSFSELSNRNQYRLSVKIYHWKAFGIKGMVYETPVDYDMDSVV